MDAERVEDVRNRERVVEIARRAVVEQHAHAQVQRGQFPLRESGQEAHRVRQRSLLVVVEGCENPQRGGGGVGVRPQAFPALAGQALLEQLTERRFEPDQPFAMLLAKGSDLAVRDVARCLEQVVGTLDGRRDQLLELLLEALEANAQQRLRLRRAQRRRAVGIEGTGNGGQGHVAAILLPAARAQDSVAPVTMPVAQGRP